MRAVVIHEFGGPEVLHLEEVDPPQPGEGQVLVAVEAASVNPADWKARRGTRPRELPLVLGYDLSGTVTESRVEGVGEGEAVFGNAVSGGYAELATSSVFARKPAAISHVQAAAIPVAGNTAWQALFDHGGLEAGQTALIAGGAGGVGHFAVQFAKRVAGARVIATGSARNREFVLGLGADEYIDYAEQDVATAVSGVDLAFDTIGGDVTMSLLPTLREGGLLVTIAAEPPVEAARERGVRAEMHVVNTQGQELERIAELVAAGTVHVEIEQTLPLDQVRRAHELSEAGHTRGKIVLTIR